jgi:peptidyl-tRNA hydrolase, PTH2 family
MSLRMYVIVRTDIDIPTGKLGGQAGHAFLNAFFKCEAMFPDRAEVYKNDDLQSKIILNGKNLNNIMTIHHSCLELNIPSVIVRDAGLTVFKEPTITCIGIGPIEKTDTPKMISKLRLL